MEWASEGKFSDVDLQEAKLGVFQQVCTLALDLSKTMLFTSEITPELFYNKQ